MSLNDRSTSTDIAHHVRTADSATFYDCPPDYRQDFKRGTLARIHEHRAPHGAIIFPAALIVCIAIGASLTFRLL